MSKLMVFGSDVEVENEEVEVVDTSTTETKTHKEGVPIDVTALEAQFLADCLNHGWLTVDYTDSGERYFLTENGRSELTRLGITV